MILLLAWGSFQWSCSLWFYWKRASSQFRSDEFREIFQDRFFLKIFRRMLLFLHVGHGSFKAFVRFYQCSDERHSISPSKPGQLLFHSSTTTTIICPTKPILIPYIKNFFWKGSSEKKLTHITFSWKHPWRSLPIYLFICTLFIVDNH